MSLIENVSKVNILLSNKGGRDKFYKALQYLLKLILELAHLRSYDHKWLPHLKRLSLRISQSRALYRLGAWLADLERIYKLVRSEKPSWEQLEKLIQTFNILISDWFDSLSCIYGIIRKDTGTSVHYCTLFWLIGIFGDLIRQLRTFYHSCVSIARLKTVVNGSHKSVALNAPKASENGIYKTNQSESGALDKNDSNHLPVTENNQTSNSEIKLEEAIAIRNENIVMILKSLADAVTATSILYPRAIGRYRIFVCSCGLFAGSVGLVQNWFALKP